MQEARLAQGGEEEAEVRGWRRGEERRAEGRGGEGGVGGRAGKGRDSQSQKGQDMGVTRGSYPAQLYKERAPEKYLDSRLQGA